MKINIDYNKIDIARKILNLDNKRGIYNDVFNLLKDDIENMISIGLSYMTILKLLENELDCSLNYKTFFAWIQKNIKQKNQSSINANNTLRNNSQIKKELLKQNNTTSTTSNTPKKEEDDDKPWWEKRVEELSKGMKEAGVRR